MVSSNDKKHTRVTRTPFHPDGTEQHGMQQQEPPSVLHRPGQLHPADLAMAGQLSPYTARFKARLPHMQLDPDGFPDLQQLSAVTYDDAMAEGTAEEEEVAAQVLELLQHPEQVRDEELMPLLARCESGRALLDLMLTQPRYALAPSDDGSAPSSPWEEDPEQDGEASAGAAGVTAGSGKDTSSSSSAHSGGSQPPTSPCQQQQQQQPPGDSLQMQQQPGEQGEGQAAGGPQEPTGEPWVDALLAYGLLGPWDSGQLQQLAHILGIDSVEGDAPAGSDPPAAPPAATAEDGSSSISFQSLQQDVAHQLRLLEEELGMQEGGVGGEAFATTLLAGNTTSISSGSGWHDITAARPPGGSSSWQHSLWPPAWLPSQQHSRQATAPCHSCSAAATAAAAACDYAAATPVGQATCNSQQLQGAWLLQQLRWHAQPGGAATPPLPGFQQRHEQDGQQGQQQQLEIAECVVVEPSPGAIEFTPSAVRTHEVSPAAEVQQQALEGLGWEEEVAGWWRAQLKEGQQQQQQQQGEENTGQEHSCWEEEVAGWWWALWEEERQLQDETTGVTPTAQVPQDDGEGRGWDEELQSWWGALWEEGDQQGHDNARQAQEGWEEEVGRWWGALWEEGEQQEQEDTHTALRPTPVAAPVQIGPTLEPLPRQPCGNQVAAACRVPPVAASITPRRPPVAQATPQAALPVAPRTPAPSAAAAVPAAAAMVPFLPWQRQQLAALAQQVLEGREPSLGRLVSLCLTPEVQQHTTCKAVTAGPGASQALMDARLQQLHTRRVAYTRAVWAARLLLAGVWLAVGDVGRGGGEEGRFVLTRGTGEGGLWWGTAMETDCRCCWPSVHRGSHTWASRYL
jgi:hypothetical protein